MSTRAWTHLANFAFILAGTFLLSGLARALGVDQMFWATAAAAAVSTVVVIVVRRSRKVERT